MIYINCVELLSMMHHAKFFKIIGHLVPEKKIFKVLLFIAMAAILVM